MNELPHVKINLFDLLSTEQKSSTKKLIDQRLSNKIM
jgi:hypothetical protein